MSENSFDQNLLRAVFAQLHFQSGLLAAKEMFGKSYFALGTGEKVAVDQAVIGMIASNYNLITPEFLAGQKQNPIGFQAQTAHPTNPGSPRAEAVQT